MVAVFGGLLLAVVGFQVYRGVQAFRRPEEAPQRPSKTPALVWVLAFLVLGLVLVAAVSIGPRVFGP